MDACLVRAGKEPAAPAALPTLFHVTHPKAGSQWVYAILRNCAAERIVPPEVHSGHYFHKPLQQGMIYPAVYSNRRDFDRIVKPGPWRRIVVIRDPRDTLISGYFSLKISHKEMDGVTQFRGVLTSVDMEDGLLYLMDAWLPVITEIQLSWLEAGERLLRYEDLVVLDEQVLAPVLLQEWELGVSREHLREVLQRHRFEKLTGGRRRGVENVAVHHRKGVAGDWQNHFTPRVKNAFKRRYGGLLVALEYERDLNW